MARYSSEPPIMLPILRRDVFNLALHQRIHLYMQIYVWEPVYNFDGDILINNHQQYVNVIDGGDLDIQDHNQENIGNINDHVNPNNFQVTNNGRNVNHPNNMENNDDIHPNFSAVQRLANYSQQIYNENVNNENEIRPAIERQDNSVTRRELWPTYPEVGDLRTTLEFYGLTLRDYIEKRNNSSNSSRSSSAFSYDTVDEPDR